MSKQLSEQAAAAVSAPRDDLAAGHSEAAIEIEPDEVAQLLTKHTRRWAGVLERLK
ncbi:hypothetical protein C6A86_018175 [Mycobacterium sp. ITM-2016-00316]|uniref:hypothetical protein n=1 Tax=Mycobacterium sp. ITM-2016-00316 TaxID=2099695 RepID=UPI001304CE35|nr:hypothetical protein [Mycobacterium sp. ITM-2016-00316]WNG80173.1 hypothetical protein C6A86_018175 [Mycobacterium sp. ITM-2016-00316]